MSIMNPGLARRPTHPGEMLREACRKLNVAAQLDTGVTADDQRIAAISPEMALRRWCLPKFE